MNDRFDTDRIDDVVLALLRASAFDDHGVIVPGSPRTRTRRTGCTPRA
ncbi:MAG: hypothetical protein KGI40_12670 [Xanthomonadaceae bacterium]|nr:hypothetical protein [Xanthomonadaceae bacterium]MDE1959918.1 hypothetical protein [Xanthomonadaceae bacterium]MDE2177020.1 hypothetical protein [Xanthomonadaceae bacterium]MDE2244536.1 hypothetical protein [Xanthomonadaceae bacterium]